MNQNSKQTQDTTVFPGFPVFNTNSNRPGVVTAYPAGVSIPPFTPRSTKLNHEQADLNRQVQNCFGWIEGAAR